MVALKEITSPQGDAPIVDTRLVFGTYRLKSAVLEIALDQALHALSTNADGSAAEPLVDTAVLYGNSETVARVLARRPNARVGTKLHRLKTIEDDLQREVDVFGGRLDRVLLHRHMPIAAWRVLERAKHEGLVKNIGVSNYSAPQLAELLVNASIKPDVVQNELHPFLLTSVPRLCAQHGILFEAHSPLTGLEHYPADLVLEIGATPAQVAIAYALQVGGGSVAFATADYDHLQQNIDVLSLSPGQIARLSELTRQHPFQKYPGADKPLGMIGEPWHQCPNSRAPWTRGEDNDTLMHVILPELIKDLQKFSDGRFLAMSPVALCIPNASRGSKAARVLNTLGAIVFPSPLLESSSAEKPSQPNGNISKKGSMLQLLLKAMRKRLDEATKERKEAMRPKTCKLRAIQAPEALLVDIPPADTFDPFIRMLSLHRDAPPPTAVRFKRGVFFPDGRMDMCKQVSQPAFVPLCEVVKQSSIVRHLLLGNNLALKGDSDGSRQNALVSLIKSDPEIETWYLAGNSIGPAQTQQIAAALESSSHAKFLWLKMNPIKLGASHLGRLITLNQRIELLDLFNTGLCDEGLEALADGICKNGGGSNLRHLYLDINALTADASFPRLLQCLPTLESLYLSVNRLGDNGASRILEALTSTPDNPDNPGSTLVRLGLGSNNLTDTSLENLAVFVQQAPKLCVLELGSYKSTRFFRESENTFTDPTKLRAVAGALHKNAATSPRLGATFFGFQHAYAGHKDADVLINQLIEDSPGQLVNGIQRGGQGRVTFTASELGRGGKHGFINPSPVELIQSVYRMAM